MGASCSSKESANTKDSNIKPIKSRSLNMENMEFIQELGNKVKLYRHKVTLIKYAIRTMPNNNQTNNEFASEINKLIEMDHPNILKYYESLDKNYIIMEYIEGVNLKNYINEVIQNNKLDEKTIAEISKYLLEILSYIFSKEIIHKDLKVENIILTNRGKLLYYILIIIFITITKFR